MAAKFKLFTSLLMLSLVYFALSTWLFDLVSKNTNLKGGLLVAVASISISAILVILYNRYFHKLKSNLLGISMGVLGLTLYIWFDSNRILNSNSLMGVAAYVCIFPVILGYLVNEKKT